jgi:pimeloyl-ACP methyl ester carboxylesterase
MKTDPSHHARKRRTSKIADEQQQQIKIYGKEKLQMPVLALGADHSLGMAVLTQVQHYATHVSGGVIANSGHWIPEEHPQALVDQLLAFFHKK